MKGGALCVRKTIVFLGLFILLSSMKSWLSLTPSVAHADEPYPPPQQGTCISCHENLYFLHDTGKWYCLRDAPMGCHGGDPTAVTKEQAHANRTAHPIINGNIARCQECHPEEASERVQIFRDVAGISPVMVAAAYVSITVGSQSGNVPATDHEQPSEESHRMILFLVVVALGTTLVITIFFGKRITGKLLH